MIELVEHPAYRLIEKYKEKRLILEYILLKDDKNETDPHKAAAIAGMEIIAERWENYVIHTMKTYPKYKRSQFRTLFWETACMSKNSLPAASFFTEPDVYYETRPKVSNRTIQMNENQSYAYAFLEPPYGTGLFTKDWRKLNKLLFSHINHLEIYQWNTNWSNYFDDGHEWWGAYFWTIYDKLYDLYTVIAASATD